MKKNLRSVLGVSLLFGVATGIYEYVLPLFLKHQGISYEKIGVVFAISGLVMVLARLYLGGLSDHWGRKPLYGLSFLVCGAGTVLTALAVFPTVALTICGQVVLKTVRDIATLTRETMQPIILYEEGHQGFLGRIGYFRGIEFLLQAGGTLLAGLIIGGMTLAAVGNVGGAYTLSLYLAGGVMLVGAVWFTLTFHEHKREAPAQAIKLQELLNFDLHPNLRVVLVASLIFTLAVQVSHGFMMPLFFSADRFPALTKPLTFALGGWTFSLPAVAIILIIHRLTIALPMMIVGHLPIKNLRAWYINGYIVQGITVAAAAFIPHVWLSAGVFLLHDLIGAGVWGPIQSTVIQRYSRSANRGLEVGKVLTWTSIGSVIGPLLAGYLATKHLAYPIFVSGILMIVAAIPLFWLNLRLPAPDEAEAKTAVPA